MGFPSGSPEIPKVGTLATLDSPKLRESQLWGPITLFIDILLRCVLKKVVALVKNFPTVFHTPLAHNEIGAIPNF
jgi:hypothetical protein